MKLRISNWAIPMNNQPAKFAETTEECVIALRLLRDTLLRESDWIMVPDSPVSEQDKNYWAIWRQQMRDITKTTAITDFCEFVEIPDPPTSYRPASWVNVEYSA